MKFSQIIDQLAADIHSLFIHPESDPEIREAASLKEAQLGTISYVEETKLTSLINTTKLLLFITACQKYISP